MIYVLVLAVLLPLALAAPVLTYLLGPRSGRPARPASWRVVGAVTACTVIAGLVVLGAGFFGASLGYSDAQDGVPGYVRAEITLTAWVPVVVLAALLAVAAALGRTSLVQWLGYLSPVLFVALVVGVATGSVTLLDPPPQPPAPAVSPVGGPCNGTPNPSNGLPDCAPFTDPASPSPSGANPSGANPTGANPTGASPTG